MKKISIKVQNLFGSLLAGAVSLLGFSSCEVEDMYGTPISRYEIKGSVKTENGDGVEGARVIMRRLDGKKAYTAWGDTVITDSKGSYLIKSEIFDVSELRIRMVCQPGSATLEADSIEMPLKFKDDGDGWTHSARETVDFTLKFKKTLPEN